MPRRLLLCLPLFAGALLAACAGGDANPAPSAPSAPATSAPTATEAGPGPASTELDRMVMHIEVLSEDIGPRLPGTPQEQAAIDYASEQFVSFGYDVELQEFAAPALGSRRTVALSVDGEPLLAAALDGSGGGEARGPLVDAGTGREEDFTDAASGAVVLVQRQDVTFLDMARRAKEAGAVAVVIANKEPGLFPGALEPASDLPVVNIGQADGEALRARLAREGIDVALRVDAEPTAHNIVARPPDGRCRTLSGAHVDSVAWAPGANDNASGSAVVLELARASAAAGLSGHCFVLFGGEESGLHGSQFFVSQMSDAERDALEAMYNYDAVAGRGGVQLVGATALAESAQGVADGLAIETEIAVLPEGASSDHAPFLEEDLPAVLFTTPDFELIHTPQDTLANLQTASVTEVAEIGLALLEGEAAGLGRLPDRSA